MQTKKIGGIFHVDDEDAIKAFQIAVYRQNMYSKLFKFDAIVKEISGMDAFEAEQAGKTLFSRWNCGRKLDSE